MPSDRHILRGTERALGTVSEEMKQQSAKPQEQSLFHEQLKWQSFAKCSNGGLMGVSTEIIQHTSKEECALCVCDVRQLLQSVLDASNLLSKACSYRRVSSCKVFIRFGIDKLSHNTYQ